MATASCGIGRGIFDANHQILLPHQAVMMADIFVVVFFSVLRG